MGATPEQGDDAEPDEMPAHEVHVDDFYISNLEVTQRLFATVMGYSPKGVIIHSPGHPVADVSWEEAVEFTKRLSEFTGVDFRLPTEAEWEYACRGGSESKHYKYSGSDDVLKVARFDNDKGNHIETFTTLKVASLRSNELDLYDMSGNVSEWVADEYYNYDGSPAPKGHVYRGGNFTSGTAKSCRVSNRGCCDTIGNGLGFRIAAKTMPDEKQLKKQIKELKKQNKDFPKLNGPAVVLVNFINDGDMENAVLFIRHWKEENGATASASRDDTKAIKEALKARYDGSGIEVQKMIALLGGIVGRADIDQIYETLNSLSEYDRFMNQY